MTDREWLELHRQSLEGWSRLTLARFRGEPEADIAELAGAVFVYHKGQFVLAATLAAEIVNAVRHSMIFEAWEYECACDIESAACRLSPMDGEVLRLASGFHGADFDALEAEASLSLQEAREALYGPPEYD